MIHASRSSVHTHRESKDARCRRGRFNAIGTGASSSSKGFYFVQASKNIGEPIIDEPCGKAGGGRKGSGPNARNAWTPTHRLIGVGCQTKKANYKKKQKGPDKGLRCRLCAQSLHRYAEIVTDQKRLDYPRQLWLGSFWTACRRQAMTRELIWDRRQQTLQFYFVIIF